MKMPTAAKVDSSIQSGADLKNGKSISSNSSQNNNGQQQQQQDPTKIANTIIEKKIRNLEKRKSRLLEIKALEDKGQQLEPDQVTAVKKLDSVVEMIDMLKEINKNVSENLTEFTKQQKKQLKKEQQDKILERNQLELDHLKLFIRIQKIMPRLSLAFKNHKVLPSEDTQVNLEDKHLKVLEDLSHLSTSDSNDESSITDYAEKMQMVLEGNRKELSDGVSHLEIRDLLSQMIETSYVERLVVEEQIIEVKENVKDKVSETVEPIPAADPVKTSPPKKEEKSQVNGGSPPKVATSSISTSKPPTTTTTTSIAESDLQKDPAVIASGFAFPPPFPPQGNGTVNFLAPVNVTPNEMEYPISYPSVSVASIPTQTFTNQNFTSTGFIQVAPGKIQPFEPVPFSQANSMPINHFQVAGQNVDSDGKKQEMVNGHSGAHHNVKQAKGDVRTTSQETSGMNSSNDTSVNGQINSNNGKRPNGRPSRGGPRGAFAGGNNFRSGRNPKNFLGSGVFPAGQNMGGHFQNGVINRPINRQNGGGPRGGYQPRPVGLNGRTQFNSNHHHQPQQQQQQQQGPTSAPFVAK